MVRLFIVRHGTAADRAEFEGSDASRPLTPKGRRRLRKTKPPGIAPRRFAFGGSCVGYLRSPNSCIIMMKMLMKSRYSVSAPMIDFLAATSSPSAAK